MSNQEALENIETGRKLALQESRLEEAFESFKKDKKNLSPTSRKKKQEELSKLLSEAESITNLIEKSKVKPKMTLPQHLEVLTEFDSPPQIVGLDTQIDALSRLIHSMHPFPEDVKTLLLLSRKDPHALFWENRFPLDLFKYLFLYLNRKTPKECISFIVGGPGVGKTSMMKRVAYETKSRYLRVCIPEICSRWYGEAPRTIAQAFQYAQESSDTTILFFDEAELLSDNRNREISTEILVQISKLNQDCRVLVVFATQTPWSLPAAFVRHVPNWICIPQYSPQVLHKLFLESVNPKIIPKDCSIESTLTTYHSPADVICIARAITIIPIRECMASKYFLPSPLDSEKFVPFIPSCKNEKPPIGAILVEDLKQELWDRVEVLPLSLEQVQKASMAQPTLDRQYCVHLEQWIKEAKSQFPKKQFITFQEK